ncbi:MAG: hypothetical protein ACR2M9_00635 [Cyanophyceae cyanobacterium]
MNCNTEYIAFATGVLVFISEALPFLDTKCNGLLHGIACIFTSECCDHIPDDKEIEIAIKPVEESKEPMEAILSIDTDSETDAESYSDESY